MYVQKSFLFRTSTRCSRPRGVTHSFYYVYSNCFAKKEFKPLWKTEMLCAESRVQLYFSYYKAPTPNTYGSSLLDIKVQSIYKFTSILVTHKISNCTLNYSSKQLNEKPMNQRPSMNISQSLRISKLYNMLNISETES